ncbi:MAG TPA: nuclear transport factor 2 family protein [Cyclobacteriaceae bacterium]|nr:nuclear transport factor 2 family protein [Cyclobacteriaceae bacterium]
MKALFLLLWLFANDEADVTKAVEALRVATVDANKQALEKIAATDLTYGHSSGLVEDKAAFVDALVSGKTDFITIILSEQVVKIVGNVATVRHKQTGDVVNSGTPAKVNISVLQVWIKVKGEWKLLARQAVKV